jgi:penicillin-binding protein 2
VRIYEDLRLVHSRLAVLQVIVALLVAGLMVQFWNLQVVRARHFRELAENNRSRLVTLAAPRGALVDRKGQLLVGNRPSFNVVLVPEHAENLDRVVSRLASALGSSESLIRERLARRQPYRSVVVKSDATLADIAVLEARRLELPEVSVEVVPLRSYPLASAAAHALGRVGEISERQLQLAEYRGLPPGALIGQAGIESRYNRELMGQDGFRRVIVNSRGLEVGEQARQPPSDGPNLRLTIDASLQAAMEAAFEGRSGSAVALDPETGEILAMTSTPAYDPNQFTTGMEPAEWARLANDPETPLMNRVIQGSYAPGSTFKVIAATAALEERLITPQTTFYCPGHLSVYNTVFRCMGTHGVVDLQRAIAISCNVYFYQVGIRLEITRLAKWGKLMGLGAPTGVDLPAEASGLMPSPEWKLRVLKTPWYAGETVSVAIGQGQVSATPLQMARVAAFVANGGRLVRPHFARRSEGPRQPPLVRPETIAAVRGGMSQVVAAGTGLRARLQTVEVCGKTGSAQVVARSRLEKSPNARELIPHGWFIAFAPAQNPKIALAVLVEHGGSGAAAAAPVARRILAHFFGLDRAEPQATPAAATVAADAED